MSKHSEAYKAWVFLNKYCDEQSCEKCVFHSESRCIWYGSDYTEEEIKKRIAELEREEEK